jgi:hypothetical protein
MSSLVRQGLTDIDAMVLAVRDRESRRLLSEAITAYRGGALRSAIMSTWIAVAYDIISKARELAGQGEAASKVFVDDLDSAIEHRAVPKMQRIESELLNTANEKLLLLSPHEHVALTRLQEDRNLCAHPAFVVEDELYKPAPDLVRSHIVHALQYLLIHAPLQGKSAVGRFEADVLSTSFPVASEDISAFIRARYLDRAKDVLVINLIKWLIKSTVGTDYDRFAGKEKLIALTLKETAAAKVAIYDATVPAFVATWFDSVDDASLLRICTLIDADLRIWEWLSQPVKLRVKRLIAASDIDVLKKFAVFDALSVPNLADDLLARFDSFDRNTQVSVATENPRIELVSRAITLYATSPGWRSAESNGLALIVNFAHLFAPEDFKKIFDAVVANDQIWAASGTPSILSRLFDISLPMLPQTRIHWQAFVDAMTAQRQADPTDHYAYPGIRSKLDAT